MTQHFYPAKDAEGNKVEIQVGWDRPMDEVFANVFSVMPDGRVDDFPVVSTLHEGVGPGMEAEELEQWLEAKGYSMPPQVCSALSDDIVFNRGNVIVRYDEAGNPQISGNH
jgi:hypothetical protein